jgi:hypothetical protein
MPIDLANRLRGIVSTQFLFRRSFAFENVDDFVAEKTHDFNLESGSGPGQILSPRPIIFIYLSTYEEVQSRAPGFCSGFSLRRPHKDWACLLRSDAATSSKSTAVAAVIAFVCDKETWQTFRYSSAEEHSGGLR